MSTTGPKEKKHPLDLKADEERLDPRRLKDELRRRAKIAGEEYMADNPGANLEDVAMDLATLQCSTHLNGMSKKSFDTHSMTMSISLACTQQKACRG